jgi:Undecaprenyl-phosphate glucose phosphotransferase
MVDCAVLVAAAFLSYWIYVDMHLGVDDQIGPGDSFRQLYVALVFFALILQLNVFQLTGLYRFSNLTNTAYQMGRSIAAAIVLFLILLVVLYLAKLSATYSRGWMLLWFLLTVSGVSAARLVICPVMERWIREGNIAARVAIVGSGGPAERLADYLGHYRDAPVTLCGIFHDGESREEARAARAAGTIDDLCQLAQTQKIDQIILATPHISEERLAEILRRMRSLPVDVRLSRDTLEYCLPQSSFEFCGIVPLLRLYNKPISGWGLLAKRIEDRLLAGLLLLIMAPVLLCIAALVKLDSRGPAIFKQQRYGFNNRVITVWKFRTMYLEQTDSMGEKQIAQDDPRVTRVGRFLRQWSLDELPQLFNVLAGDMSIVGPRPHPLMCGVAGRLFEEVVEEYAARHRVKPGITGWAQVHGWHGAADTNEKIQERVKHDLYYIDNWSVLLDLKILLMTVYIVLRRENA